MTTCNRYSEEFISRFVDEEVSPADRAAFLDHREDCRACREKEAGFRGLTAAFQRHADIEAKHILKELPPMETAESGKTKGWLGFKKYTGLKLASLGAAAAILAAVLLPLNGERPAEPTAIVNSLDTYGSSVMIIETPENQHTIIWFSET